MRCSNSASVVVVVMACVSGTGLVATASGQDASGPGRQDPGKQDPGRQGRGAAAETKLDVAGVRTEWGGPYHDPVPADAPRLFVLGHVKYLPRHYYWARFGQVYPGTRFVLGYLGSGFAGDVDFVAERFERQGRDVRLEFRHVVRSGFPHGADRGTACFFAAPLPDELPDGDYRLTVTIRDLPPGTDAKESRELRFQKPDPRIKGREAEVAGLRELAPEALLARYRRAVAEAKDFAAPREETPIGLTRDEVSADLATLLPQIEWEMKRRKLALSPLLIRALAEECVKNPDGGGREGIAPVGIARKLMEMLVEVGDARAAPVMVDILADRLRCNRYVRRAALKHLEELTYVRFRKTDPRHPASSGAVLVADTWVPSSVQTAGRDPFEPDLAKCYERWLLEHPAGGPDTGPWLKVAQGGARAWLESDDLEEAYNGAAFLRGYNARRLPQDDDPAATTGRIAEILQQCTLDSEPPTWQYPEYRHVPTGKRLPLSAGNWLQLLVAAGPIPERYAGLVVRFDPGYSERPGATAQFLNEVGGVEAMTYRLATYRRLVAEAEKNGWDPQGEIGSMQNPARQAVVGNLQLSRFGIERWSGRTFGSDREIDAWWSGTRDRSLRRWLEPGLANRKPDFLSLESPGRLQASWLKAGLPILAGQADAGDARSQYLLRIILPEALPHKPDHSVWLMPGWWSSLAPHAETVPPFRAKWVADHAGRLECLPERGVFVLGPAGAAR